MTADDLRDYFSKFGEVTDVFIPKPFRAFAFITFLDPEVAQSLCGEDHIVKGVSVHISNAAPKTDPTRMGHGGPGSGPGGSGAGGGLGGGPGGHYPMMGSGHGKRDGKNAPGGPTSAFGQHGGHYGHSAGAGGMGMAGNATGAGWTPPGPPGGGRASMEMPNIQALGLSNNQGGQQSGSNPLAGMAGLNMGLPMNPALVAAALNQAGWGLIGNLQGGGGPAGAGTGTEHPPFPTPTSFSTPGGNVTTTQVGGGHNTMGSGNASGILAGGWGATAAAAPGGGPGAEGMPAATPPGTVTPQHHPTTPGSWPSQPKRDSHQGSGGGGGGSGAGTSGGGAGGSGGGGSGGGSWKSYDMT